MGPTFKYKTPAEYNDDGIAQPYILFYGFAGPRIYYELSVGTSRAEAGGGGDGDASPTGYCRPSYVNPFFDATILR